MKTDKIELSSEIETKNAKKMSKVELTRWFAFCNALKFLNLAEKKFNKQLDEEDITYKALHNYVQTTSGDILSCLESYQGVPLKYSLNTEDESAHQTDEVIYPY